MFSDHESMKYIFTQRDLNMRQRRWMKFLEDHDFTLHYHPGKENVVVDVLSLKSRGVLASIVSREWQMLETAGQFRLQYNEQAQGTLRSLMATPSLLNRVIESQGQDTELVSTGTEYNQVQRTKAGLSTQMVVLGIGDGLWSPNRRI